MVVSRPFLWLSSFIAIVLLFVIVEGLWILVNGKPVPTPTIPREEQTIGHGPYITYAIMGDSTTVAQGAAYSDGYAVATAQHLSASYTVSWFNVGVSGARAHDVATTQLAKVTPKKPDVVLIAVGANDVTHLTSLVSVRQSLQTTIAGLRKANPEVAIVLTGSPQMGSVIRFGAPVAWLAGQRTNVLNHRVMQLAHDEHVVFAPVAERTGPLFAHHPELFASDKFHPNAAGYKTWIPVLNEALDAAL